MSFTLTTVCPNKKHDLSGKTVIGQPVFEQLTKNAVTVPIYDILKTVHVAA